MAASRSHLDITVIRHAATTPASGHGKRLACGLTPADTNDPPTANADVSAEPCLPRAVHDSAVGYHYIDVHHDLRDCHHQVHRWRVGQVGPNGPTCRVDRLYGMNGAIRRLPVPDPGTSRRS